MVADQRIKWFSAEVSSCLSLNKKGRESLSQGIDFVVTECFCKGMFLWDDLGQDL